MDAFILGLEIAVFPGIFFLIIISFFYEWIDRKFYADVQNRIGPLYTGPLGLMQPFADFVKLMSKEDLTPKYSDKKIFNSVPIVMTALMLTALFTIPVIDVSGLLSFRGDIIFAIVALTFFAILVFLGGFSSTNRFALVGAERAVLQLLGYEIPLMLSVVGVCIFTGSVMIGGIVSWQTSHLWTVIGPQLLSFFILIVAAQAELGRVPFDIPEAEQEIVAGWMTEYSGRKLALIRLSKDLEMVFISALAVTLFLGGPSGPIVPGWEVYLYPVYFLIKTAAVILVLATIRGVFARMRIDQMLSLAWKYLIPLSLVQLFITIAWRLL